MHYSTKLIAIYHLGTKKLNDIPEYYEAIARKSHAFREEKLADKAKENLEMIGKFYSYEQ